MQTSMPATTEHHLHVLRQLVDAPMSQRRIFGFSGILQLCAQAPALNVSLLGGEACDACRPA
jgi:hypothetical protein